MITVREKVGAFVIRLRFGKPALLLLFAHSDFPEVPLQIPGGGIEAGESPEQALWRELHEEAGLNALPLIRKIGVSEASYQEFLLRRHCYLLDGSALPESWKHRVHGKGEDMGLNFAYAWHSIDSTSALSGDLGYFLNPRAIPELYSGGCTN